MILAGDIGGTKTVMALFEKTGADSVRLHREHTFKSGAHPTFDGLLVEFLKMDDPGPLDAGCFGVAGAVIDGTCKTTNLPWQLEEEVLAKTIRAPRVKLLNDLEAAALGMLYLTFDEICILNPGQEPRRKGNVAVVAAGTGLGEAILYWDGSRHQPLASEGGHCEFAPHSDQEIELLKYLRVKYGGHVSYERILSGPGFTNVFNFLKDTGFAKPSDLLEQELKTGDLNPTVTRLGMEGKDALCVETCKLFCRLYGAEAGNLALKCMAVGGVFVGGGIAPRMLPALQDGSFMEGFLAKGRFKSLMKSIPVAVGRNPRTPLMGAAHYALRL